MSDDTFSEDLEKNEKEILINKNFKQPKLLVDVDNTLVHFLSERLNENIVTIFELFGLKKLSFLTNMAFSSEPSINIASRTRLIKTLKERGFDIEYVHTTLDLPPEELPDGKNHNICDKNSYQPGSFYNVYYKGVEEQRDELIKHPDLINSETRVNFFKQVKADIKINKIRKDQGFIRSDSFIKFYKEKYQFYLDNHEESVNKLEKKDVRKKLAEIGLISEEDIVIFIDDSPKERNSYSQEYPSDFVVRPPRNSEFDNEVNYTSCADFVKFLCDKVKIEPIIDEHTVDRFVYLAKQEAINGDVQSAKFLYAKARECADNSGKVMDCSEDSILNLPSAINKIDDYVGQRKSESRRYHTLSACFFKHAMSSENKTGAANQWKNYLGGDKNVRLSKAELECLKEGRLSKAVDGNMLKIYELEQYIKQRESEEADYLSKPARYFKKTLGKKENKIAAAKHMIAYLGGEEVTIHKNEFEALKDGRLKKLVDQKELRRMEDAMDGDSATVKQEKKQVSISQP